MNANSFPKKWLLLASSLMILLFIGPGCKKSSSSKQPSTDYPAAKQIVDEKEFLADPDVTTCELEKTTLSKLNLTDQNTPSFVYRMKQENKEDLWQSEITLANHKFEILLGERPGFEFYLCDTEKGFTPYGWGSQSLYSYHKIDDTFYQFQLIENGRKLAAHPYRGELGIIRIGKGSRNLEKIEFNGSLRKADAASVPVGTLQEQRLQPVQECLIPVGDYTPHIIDITYDNLKIMVSNNYHTNAQGQSNRDGTKKTVYGMTVRKDQPYTLDFSNEPMVIFDQPPQEQKDFSPGQEIEFAAVLIDPKLDIMIRRLDDTSQKVQKEYKDDDGNVTQTVEINKSLDPKVVITRGGGEIVAEGAMPFG
jgi:hypothetical protein